jgi:hypothetical protein
LILFVLHQYIGAADQLAPIFWCCYHLKKDAKFLNFLNVSVSVPIGAAGLVSPLVLLPW